MIRRYRVMPQHPTHRRRTPRSLPAIGPLPFAICIAGIFFATSPIRAIEIRDAGQGLVQLTAGDVDITELSGIAHAGGNRYYAVSDKGGRLFPLTIEVDRETGFIAAAAPEDARILAGGYDLEGIALLDDETVIVCDEVRSILTKHRLVDGSLLKRHPLPALFRPARPNLGVESLARTQSALWTANEEALKNDGPTASQQAGTRVRVQRLEPDGTPAGQWAYETDPHPGPALFGRAFSGVSELLALPGGELLVLERSFSSPGFRARIYLLDFTKASRTEELRTLEDETIVLLGKRLLWESRSFTANFEGITLGPALAAGDFSLILVADDGGAGPPALYALRLRADGLEREDVPLGGPAQPGPQEPESR